MHATFNAHLSICLYPVLLAPVLNVVALWAIRMSPLMMRLRNIPPDDPPDPAETAVVTNAVVATCVVFVPAVAVAAVIAPLTSNDESVPTLVMFGCAAVVTVPAVVDVDELPTRAPVNVVAASACVDGLYVSDVSVLGRELPDVVVENIG